MVVVEFSATLQGTVNYSVDNQAPIQAVTAQNLADNFGTDGGFVVVSVAPSASSVTYFAMKDGCKAAITALKEMRALLAEKVAIWAHMTNNISASAWGKCTITERHRLLAQFMTYGSGNVATVLATARASESTFGSRHDLLGARALQITTAGHYCISYHRRAALDHVCPGGLGCPPDGTLTKNGVVAIDLDDISCPMSSNTVVYSLLVVVLFSAWLFTFSRWIRRANEPGGLEPMTTAKIIQLESYKRLQDARDKEETFQAMLKDPIKSSQMPPRLREHLNSASAHFTSEVAHLMTKNQRVPCYWFYMELTGDACGPIADGTMNEMYHESNYLMDHNTLVREAWWPPDKFYTVGELFPESTTEEYFVSEPKIPDVVTAFVAGDVFEPSVSVSVSAAASVKARRVKSKSHLSKAKDRKIRQVLGDDGLGQMEYSTGSLSESQRLSSTVADSGNATAFPSREGERIRRPDSPQPEAEPQSGRRKQKSTRSAPEPHSPRSKQKSTTSAPEPHSVRRKQSKASKKSKKSKKSSRVGRKAGRTEDAVAARPALLSDDAREGSSPESSEPPSEREAEEVEDGR
eukprot:GEMP01010733.1.p1 GENE.GEMP01010733.1~~GEMP01010733.1.p1  ORF type:complete len:577 (+),score=131.68 GEMP01010733.1:171-1901(+)